MLFGYDPSDPSLAQAIADGHIMTPQDQNRDLWQERMQSDDRTGYSAYGDGEARRVLAKRPEVTRTLARRFTRAAFGNRPISWDNAASSGEDYYGGLSGKNLNRGERELGFGAPPTGPGSWHGTIATIDGYDGGGILGMGQGIGQVPGEYAGGGLLGLAYNVVGGDDDDFGGM